MKNILVVFTGGTIGSTVAEHTINTQAENRYRLLSLYQDNFPRAQEVNFSYIAPLDILSENMSPRSWEQLINQIDTIPLNDVDGIIVTHGTDTLAFTSSLLAIYYRNINVPMLLVSSDYPLTDRRANGLDNFNAAIEFICQRGEAGIFVAYQNPLQSMLIHQGHRLASCLPLSSDFISVQHKAYLKFEQGHFAPLNALDIWDKVGADCWPLRPQLAKNVLLLRPYPGLNYACVNLTGVTAVLHDLYHSGTACVDGSWGEDYSLLQFLQRCVGQGIRVYLAPAIKSPDIYASTRLMVESGGIFIWNTTLETAYAKLLLGYGNFPDANLRTRFIQTQFNEQF